MARSATLLVVVCACSSNAPPRDATTTDIDNGTCGSQQRFTGELVDWDSSASAFCGVFGAHFQVEGGAASASTAPNGRFDLCVPAQPVVLIDITPPTDPSQCTAQPVSYALPAIAVANRAEIEAGGMWSGRLFGMGIRTPTAGKAQVFVHVNGTPRAVSLAAAHDASEARNSDTWAPGDTGTEVFFPNVDPTGGTTMLSAAGAIGTGPIPVAADKMTEVSIIAN